MSKHLPPSKNKHEKIPEPSVLNAPLKERRFAHAKNELTELKWQNYVPCAISGAFLLTGCVFSDHAWLPVLFFSLAFLSVSAQTFLRAADEIIRFRLLEGDLLLLVSSLIFFCIGQYSAAALLMLTYRVLRLLEGFLEKCSSINSESLTSFLPEKARLINERGIVEEIEPERIVENDILEVGIGEVFPVDGRVVNGNSSMDISPLTGTAVNADITVGSSVYCGCINVSSPVRIEAICIYSQSGAVTLSNHLVKAEKYKAALEKYAVWFERYFPLLSVALALLSGIIVPLFDGKWVDSLNRAAVLLGISVCSCLAFCVSYAYRCGLVMSLRRGIYFKANKFFENMSDAETFVFNKTGTLTEGRYSVVDVAPSGISEQELLAVAAHAESLSSHPIAKAICREYGAEPGAGLDVTSEEIAGLGVVSSVNGKKVHVGNAALLSEIGIECPIPRRGGAAIHVAINGMYAGHIIVADKTRENAFDHLESLRMQGVKNLITLTSDVRSVSRTLASSLNMDMVRAELSPDAKVSAIEYLAATKAERSTLAFVCNGAGDAEALRRADIGISLGAAGNTDAYESGDIIIMSSRLSALSEALMISKRVHRNARILLSAFVISKIILVLLTVFGTFSAIPIFVMDFLITAALFLYTYTILFQFNHKGRKI